MSDNRYAAIARAEPERERRVRCLLRGTMIDERNVSSEIVIRNVSRHGIGAALRQGRHLRVPQNVAISLPNDVVAWGETRWVSDQNFGILLEHELDPDTIINKAEKPVERRAVERAPNARQRFLLREE